MKATGITRKVDELGRIVLPVELRRTMDIPVRTPLEIYVDGDKVILKKYNPACTFCGNVDNTVFFKNKLICKTCINKLVNNEEDQE